MHFTQPTGQASLLATFAARRCWLAIRSTDQQAVIEALPVVDAQPASWRSCAEALDGPRLLVSAPIDGWIVVIGGALPGPGNPAPANLPLANGSPTAWYPDRCTPLLVDLSRRLGTVQSFATQPAFDLHAWAAADNGQITRSFAYSGAASAAIWNRGAPTPVERDRRPHAEMAYEIAAAWSVDPRQVWRSFAAELGAQGPDLSGAFVGDLGPRYDEIDSRKLSLGEYWRAAPGPAAVAGGVAKLLGVRIGGDNYVPLVARLWWIQFEHLPADAQIAMSTPMNLCEQAGMKLALIYTVPHLEQTEAFGACFVDENREFLAQVMHIRVGVQNQLRHKTLLALYTPLAGGAVLATASDSTGGFTTENVREEIARGASLDQVLARHRQRIAEARRQSPPMDVPPAPGDADAIERFLLQQEQAEIDEGRRRRICHTLSMDEVNRVRTKTWAMMGS